MDAPPIQSHLLAKCHQVLRHYIPGEEAATIVPLAGSGGFSGAEIWQVEWAGNLFALRCWPSKAPDRDRLIGLHQLLEHTSRLGVTQISVPCRTFAGQTLIEMHERCWQLEPWMPGAATFHQDPSRIRLQSAMRVLARWHIAARSFVPSAGEATWFASNDSAPSPGLAERATAISQGRLAGIAQHHTALQTFPDKALGSLLSRICQQFLHLAPRVEFNIQQALPLRIPVQPALRDVWHDHLLFTGNELTGLIDASACRTESVVTDLARLLGSLVEDKQAEWDFALATYQQVRPLSLSELRLLRVFDQSGVLLSGLTWLDWLLVQKRLFPHREPVLGRITKVLHAMEKLGAKL